jgi:hypothetical protein
MSSTGTEGLRTFLRVARVRCALNDKPRGTLILSGTASASFACFQPPWQAGVELWNFLHVRNKG